MSDCGSGACVSGTGRPSSLPAPPVAVMWWCSRGRAADGQQEKQAQARRQHEEEGGSEASGSTAEARVVACALAREWEAVVALVLELRAQQQQHGLPSSRVTRLFLRSVHMHEAGRAADDGPC